MARNNDRDRDRSGSKKMTKEVVRKGGKKKVCIFCAKKVDSIGYKDVDVLRKYMSDRGKIRARRVSGNCSQHQRAVAIAIKTARELALLPYTQRTVAERSSTGRTSSRSAAVAENEETYLDPNQDFEELSIESSFNDLEVDDDEIDEVAEVESLQEESE